MSALGCSAPLGHPALVATAIAAVTMGVCACRSVGGVVTEASQSLYVRNDTDRTTIVSPRSQLSAAVAENLQLQASYAVDVWTGASIDVRTAATAAIHETRHEVGIGGAYSLAETTVTTRYRYSIEPDYVSHGGVLGVTSDFAQRNTTLSMFVFGGHDTVGRANDPSFGETLDSLGGRVGISQVLHEGALARVGYEATALSGFQASVYRWVGVGSEGTCASLSPFCVPEKVPNGRTRRAATGGVRQALGKAVSLDLDYRFYFDSWGVRSQTLTPSLTLLPNEAVQVTLDYRYYTQNGADFYRPRYFDLQSSGGHVTRDRKLSAQYSQRAGIAVVYRIPAGPRRLVAGLRTSVTRIDYRAFVGLEHVYAIEASGFIGLER